MDSLALFVVIAAILVLLLVVSIRRVRGGEYGVIFRAGALLGGKEGPGLVRLIPFLDGMRRVDLRPQTMDVVLRDARTLDGFRVEVEAIARYRVSDPEQSVVQVEDYAAATGQVMQTALRSLISQTDLDQLGREIESINEDLKNATVELTSPWGVEILSVEVKAARKIQPKDS